MVWLGISGWRPALGARGAGLACFVLMAVKDLHDTILRRQFSFLKPLLFQFLFRGQVELAAERFELAFKLGVLLV
jgi:hypothetical protein